MAKLHEDYYLRKCFLEKNEVPSQSTMKKKMGTALANICFKSMRTPLKRLAGLYPPLNGGGKDWYIPPEELLKGRIVLKPIAKTHLTMLSYEGIIGLGENLVGGYLKRLEEKQQKLLEENDSKWEKFINEECEREREAIATEAKNQNTSKIQEAFQEFAIIYRNSVTKIECLLMKAGKKEQLRIKDRVIQEMSTNFQTLLRKQSEIMSNKHKQKLEAQRSKMKEIFIKDLEELQTNQEKELQKLHHGKHLAVEKIRTLLEYRNLACQMYVALKEQTECKKELDTSKGIHKRAIKKISNKITVKDLKIKIAIEKQKKQEERRRLWKMKICPVVKRFQEFVKYCLKTVPDHADYFINMESLMLIHLGETLENPTVESIFEYDNVEEVSTPPLESDPFYLICDEGFKPKLDQSLFPACATCRCAQFPAIVVNKRIIYTPGHNFDLVIDNVKQFVDGKRGNDDDFIDDHDYAYDVPIDCTSSVMLRELQMQSSLMQILQNSLPNVKQVVTKCKTCCSYYCFCVTDPNESHSGDHSGRDHSGDKLVKPEPDKYDDPPRNKITLRTDELRHMREPKIDSYLNYILPPNCECTILRKKLLYENLPAYVKNVSKFEKVYFPDYETCSLYELKHLVNKSHRQIESKHVVLEAERKTKDISTQYSDHEFDELCNFYDDKRVFKMIERNMKSDEVKSAYLSVFDKSFSASHIEKQLSDFALDSARKLKTIVRDTPELQELFRAKDCNL